MNYQSFSFYFNKLKEFKTPPCLYCPGNCILQCPTFQYSKNLLYSPIGYVKIITNGIENCLRCWRCTYECPANFPIPIWIDSLVNEDQGYELNTSKVMDGEFYLIGESKYTDKMIMLAKALNIGVRTINKTILFTNYTTNLKIRNNLIAYSPEIAFLLSIPHYSEELYKFTEKTDINISLHIPCLLLNRKNKILKSLHKTGIDVIRIDDHTCIKLLQERGKLKNMYSLCPKALKYKGKTLDVLIYNKLVFKKEDK